MLPAFRRSAAVPGSLRTVAIRSMTNASATTAPTAPRPNEVYDIKMQNIVNSTRYGGRHTVTLIPGDGIGIELAHAVQTVFNAANVPVDWEMVQLSGETEGDQLYKAAVESLKRNKVGLKGVLYTPVSRSGHTSFNVGIRKELDLYANTVICKNIPGYQTRHSNVDIAIIRENTEGEYSGLEHSSYPGVVESLKVITRSSSERIAKYAFDFAVRNGRKKVTAIHKANIMKLGDGLFLRTCEDVASRYKEAGIKFESMIVDNACMQLVAKPQQFDVMVMPNLYGNIISNVGAALVGGPGISPGGNVGREYALFEPGARHMAKDIQGKNMANPTAMIYSGCMMLRHLGLDDYAFRISNAVHKVYSRGAIRTADMGGKASTTDFTFAIIANL